MLLIETDSLIQDSEYVLRRTKKKNKKSNNKQVKTKPPKEIKRFPRPVKRYPKPEGWVPPSYRIIVKKEMDAEALDKWLSTIPGLIEGLTEDAEGEPSQLYDYQIEHMINVCSFMAVDKARQIGLSYTEAAKALAKCHLKLLQTSIFISKDKEEANEKIRFARILYESMQEEYKRKLIIDNKQSLEFEYKGKRNRILSFAQRQPRGKGNNTDILLDEMAHMIWAREIYVASLPVISRGTGTITVASTPLGKNTLHYEICNDRAKYRDYSRMQIFWWDCPEICINVEEARKFAPFMETKERVNKYGTTKLKGIYNNSEEEDFKQEYELYYIDSSVSYFPLDLIRTCVFEDEDKLIIANNVDPEEFTPGWAPLKGDSGLIVPDTIMNLYSGEDINWYCDINSFHDSNTVLDNVEQMVDKLIVNMQIGNFGRNLLFGMDIGRKRDSSEISIFEEIELDTHNLHVERLSIELINIPFRTQKDIVRMMVKKLPVIKANIDGTPGSHGADLAESIEFEFPQVVESIKFDLESKAQMSKNFRFRLEDRAIALYNDSQSIKQIHSIKKIITDSANIKYGTEKSRKHHGDKFWSKALASIGGHEYDRDRILNTNNVVKLGDIRKYNNGVKNKGNSIIGIINNSIVPKINESNGRNFMRSFIQNRSGTLTNMFCDLKYRG